jgi:hypothetical protein
MALLALVAALCCRAELADNLALGKPYTLDPAPNYPHCTDPGDTTQLTDGDYTSAYFWTQRSTVGWTGRRPIIITVDLGATSPIRGASFNTAAGVAGVQWPESIALLVSDDGKSFRFVGDLIALSARRRPPPSEGYAVHRFQTEDLKTHGRFVSFVLSPSEAYGFVDEVEVLPGEAAWLDAPVEGEAFSEPTSFYRAYAQREAGARRVRADAGAVRTALAQSPVAPQIKARVAAELDAAERDLPGLPLPTGGEDRAILPLNAAHERVFRAQAMFWRGLKLPPITVWESGLWDPLSPTQAPPKRPRPVVSVALMQNEFRAAAFNISNAGDQPRSLQLEVRGLPGGSNPPYVTVHEVAWTDTRTGTPVAAALPEARRSPGGFTMEALPGLTRQVWLTFHPTNVPAGTHRGTITLSAGGDTWKVPVALRLYPLRFPDAPTLHLGGWDYTDQEAMYDVTPHNRAALIAHLRDHFVDSPWATAAVLPPGRYDAVATMTAEPDTALFDAWLKSWPGARQYCVFAAVGDQFDGSRLGSREFNQKVRSWITFWTNHTQRRGLRPQQLVLLLVDEPTEPRQDQVILAWARAIHAADTGVRIWEDPCHPDPAAADEQMMRACDVLCPNRVAFLAAKQNVRDYYVHRREHGGELAFYSCSGPVRLLDPYTYHRLQAWSCWQFGAQASYFWAFGDSGGGSSWNEYAAPRTAFTPLFLEATSVTAGKHLEAIREGLEDYEYLVMLDRRLKALAMAGASGRAVDRAQQLLAGAAARVTQASGAQVFNWSKPKDRSLADQVRLEILETLASLQ